MIHLTKGRDSSHKIIKGNEFNYNDPFAALYKKPVEEEKINKVARFT